MHREIEYRVLNVTEKFKSKFAGYMEFTTDPDEKDVRLMIEEVLKEVHSKGRRLERDKR